MEPIRIDKRIGNEFWKARSSHGRKPKFRSAQKLREACEEYFEWNNENPLYVTELVKFQGTATPYEVPKMRPMTMGGLYEFLDISRDTWNLYKARKGFIAVIEGVEQTIYRQKFEGAAADLLNPNIIARDLGLSDKKEVTGAGGQPLNPDKITFEYKLVEAGVDE
ncbi:MAG: DNA-packaging protein [Gammaproteobacteria bacterium]|nr:DNA-packaging protein [Gammaproteobacteria bacterium]